MDAASGAEGQWIADALEQNLTKERWDECFGTVAATIPDGFESYARIFHRVNGNAEPDIRWADVAASKGTRVHPEVQFHTMARVSLYRHAVLDGVLQGPPDHGELDTIQLAALALILQAHATTPQDIYQAVWNGWGGFEPGRGSIPAGPEQSLTVAKGFRSYWVFRGGFAELAHPPWFDDEPGTNTQSPNLAWPVDRSWCMATEIDFDSTLVGGTAELIAAVVHSPGLEALEVTISSNLSSEGDTVNI
jgi:hypothetical protein